MTEYAKRDILKQGNYYMRHVAAMTAEGLHDKSDIAAELAHRDIEIDRLRADCAEAYQVVGAGMLGEPCEYTQADVERALDNLSAAANGAPRPHADLLPWPK